MVASGATLLVSALQSAGMGLSSGMTDFMTGFLPVIMMDVFVLLLGGALLSAGWWKQSFCAPQKGHGGFIFHGTIACLGASGLNVLFISGLLLLFQLFGLQLTLPALTMSQDDPLAAVLYVGYVCLLGPILEELIFRGLLLQALLPYGKGLSVVVTALLFGLFHGNPFQFFTGFFVGLVLGFMVVQTKSIWPGIIGHVFNNTFVSVPEFFSIESEIALGIWSTIYLALGLVALLAWVIIYTKRLKHTLKAPQGLRVQVYSLRERVKLLCFNPLMAVYLVQFVVSCLLILIIYIQFV